MKQGHVRALESLTDADLARFGGKAIHLAKLVRSGFPVPHAFCIASGAFARFVEHNELLPRLQSLLARLDDDPDLSMLAEVRSLIRGADHVPEFTTEVARAYARMSTRGTPALVSVRSSARSEDSSQASFAGQHDTVLNVQGLDTLYDAIKAGWASLYSDRAVLFRRHRGLPIVTFEMGLIVQQMVEPTVSGVLFTVNPMTGATHEMLLEAGWGLGEAFVSGRLSPDTFFLSRPFHPRLPARVAVRRQRIADKSRMLVSRRTGTGKLELVPVPPEKRLQPAVTRAQAAEIGRIGLRLERLFHAPQDVEWAIDHQGVLHLLQARPITALITRRHQRRPGILWTQRFSGERWTEPVTHLSWSIIQPVLHHFIHFEQATRNVLQGSEPTRVVNGYPYFNITIFRHLLWKLPAFAPPQFILELFPKDEQDEILAAPFILPDVRLVGSILLQVARERRWRRYRWNFLTNHADWERFLPRFLEAIESLPEAPATPEEARAAVAVGQDWIREYVKIHLLSLLFANLYFQLLVSLLQRWVGEGRDEVAAELVAEPETNKTVETNAALWRLAGAARQEAAVREWLLADGEKTEQGLRQVAAGTSFLSVWDRFLAEYGHRSNASWEIFSPRWRDRPEIVLQILAGYLKCDPPAGGRADQPRRRRARSRAEARVLDQLQFGHTHQRMTFLHVLRSTRKYMALRENQRFYFDKLLLRIKQNLEALGQMWETDGLLEDAGDITLLTLGDVDEVLAGRLQGERLKEVIRARRQAYQRQLEQAHPVFLEGQEAETPIPENGGDTLVGLGISPGRVRGPARIIRSLAEVDKLQKGDILVARATDPGWTPLFLTAAGLITELGSMLSHGAVVAREYGLPAIVNVASATTILRDGQMITVDGHRGVVYLH